MRRDLSQHVKAREYAMDMDRYRDQLRDVALHPNSDAYFDQLCKQYSLRRLAKSVVCNDRAFRMARCLPVKVDTKWKYKI